MYVLPCWIWDNAFLLCNANLVPRPHPQGGKRGLVNLDTILGPGKGIWVLQWDCSFSVVIWLTNHRNTKCHCLLYEFESSAHAQPRPGSIRSKVYFTTSVSASAHWAAQTKETVQIHRTPLRMGSGHETNRCRMQIQNTCGMCYRELLQLSTVTTVLVLNI